VRRFLLLVTLVAVSALALLRSLRQPPTGLGGPVSARPLAFPRASGAGLRAEPAFPALRFERPLFLCAAPGDDAHVFVVEQAGRIRRVALRPDTREAPVFLDIAARVSREDNEEGLLGLAFDPDYMSSRAFYVYYSAASPRRSVLSRLHVPPGSAEADPKSEEVLLEIPEPYGNHNGGMVAFGPDGFLYVGVGDGGSGGDPHGNGQNRTTLLGTILRIDPRGGSPYAIPEDNPFADGALGARPEIWAFGLRNPWRFSFGPDGRLWVGDVGQDRREEIDIVVRGGNYGWNVFEGAEVFRRKNVFQGEGAIPPVHDYPHGPGVSVTGGYVYRGSELPAYRGRYFFGDYASGQVWTLTEAEDGTWVREVSHVPSLSSFGEDSDGELYAVSLGGSIYRFRERSEEEKPAPTRLSETGIFSDTKGLVPAPGVLAYDVLYPAWHDGASARRWIALPPDGRIRFDALGSWTFPPGTALVMHLERDGRRLETRVLFRDDDGWAAYSYRWNDAQTDAIRSSERVEAGGWTYPDVTECFACHNDPAGRVLGVRTSQLDRPFDYDGNPKNQIEAWNGFSLFDRDISGETRPEPLPGRDGAAPLERRARAYLDVNCACCHRQGGLTPSMMDLRYGVPLAAMGIVDRAPRQPPTGSLADRILAPGRPEGSQLWQRTRAEGTERMPPRRGEADPLGENLLRQWIEGMAR